MDCTILIIWHQKNIYDKFMKSISKQVGVKYELISIDNSNGQYIGARQAFQYAIEKNDIVTELIIFVHQDIEFLEDTCLLDIVQMAKKIGRFGVIGVAGCPYGKKWMIYSNIVNGKEKIRPGYRITKPMEVQTVDECLFVMNKDYLYQHPFSSLPGQHLYAVEQCISASRDGYPNYVIPVYLWHFSKGNSLNAKYMHTLEIILRDIRRNKEIMDNVVELNTTVKQWKVSGISSFIYRFYYKQKQRLKYLLKG